MRFAVSSQFSEQRKNRVKKKTSIKAESIRVVTGANAYSRQPVIVARLDLEKLKNKRSGEVSGFDENLVEKFPNLRDHSCDRGRGGGFVERLAEGTHFNRVVEHIAIELPAEAGLARRGIKIRAAAAKKIEQSSEPEIRNS